MKIVLNKSLLYLIILIISSIINQWHIDGNIYWISYNVNFMLHLFLAVILYLVVFKYSLHIYLLKIKSMYLEYSAFVYVFFIFYIISYKNGLKYFNYKEIINVK